MLAEIKPELDHLAEHRMATRHWLREMRRRHAISQYELANRLGIFQPVVANWERGKQFPSPYYRRVLNRLARDVSLPPMPVKPEQEGDAAMRQKQ